MKLAIVGSRTGFRAADVYAYVDTLAKDIEVVSGGAPGVDSFAAGSAFVRDHVVKVFHADWDKHGKAAGPIRNAEIVKYCDELVAFWDGMSRGTANVIGLAAKAGKLRRVFVPGEVGSGATGERP